MINERRKFPRLDLNIKVKYKILTDMEKNIFSDFETYVNEAHSRNISVNGICIQSEKPIAPNTIIGMEINFPEQKQPICALGKIIWSKPLERKGNCFSGVEFVAIKEKYFDQMSQLIAQYVVEKYKIKETADKKGLVGFIKQLFKNKKKGT